MAQLTKKRKAVDSKVDKDKLYSLNEAMGLVKEVNTTKFNASVDVHVRLGVDPRKADRLCAVRYHFRMVPAKPNEYWFSVRPRKKTKQKKPALISSASTITSRRSPKAGWMWTSSSPRLM